jgi:hypothetical protein
MQNELVFKRKKWVILVLIFFLRQDVEILVFRWTSCVNEDSLSRDRSKNFHY